MQRYILTTEARRRDLPKGYHIKRIKNFLPDKGHVGILSITDKQFGMMELFNGKSLEAKQTGWQQLELF